MRLNMLSMLIFSILIEVYDGIAGNLCVRLPIFSFEDGDVCLLVLPTIKVDVFIVAFKHFQRQLAGEGTNRSC